MTSPPRLVLSSPPPSSCLLHAHDHVGFHSACFALFIHALGRLSFQFISAGSDCVLGTGKMDMKEDKSFPKKQKCESTRKVLWAQRMAKGILEASLEERAAKMIRPFQAKEAAGTETAARWGHVQMSPGIASWSVVAE